MKKKPKHTTHERRLRIEHLESRDMLAVQLQNPELAMALRVTDAARAHEFYVESLGMTDKGEASNPPPGMRMFLYGSGQATLKIRDSEIDPPGRDPSLLAENGLRFVTIPVADFDGALTRLTQHGFAAPAVRTEDGVRTGMATDGDGNVVEIIDAATAPSRKLEMGIIIPEADVASAQSFYSSLLVFPGAPSVLGPSPAEDTTEYRYAANNTVLRVFAPPGERPVPDDDVGAVLGYRYITFTVAADLDLFYNELVQAGVEIVTPLSAYGTTAMLFVARGPGGAIHEFVGPPHVEQPEPTAFTNMAFTADYYAPSQPTGSALSETLEALSLEPHVGRLFCSTSYAEAGGPSTSNPKILVKDTAASPWRVDYEAGSQHVRIPILRSVEFTTDGAGNLLTDELGNPQPVSVLVAGTGQWRSWFDPEDPDQYGVYVLSRDDTTNQWVEHKLDDDPWNPPHLNHANEVRMLFDHVDQVTGVHYVFANSQNGRVYRGWYDAAAPGHVVCRSIRPSPFPEEAGRVWYFCGFDLTGMSGGSDVTGSRGWIYRGDIGTVVPLSTSRDVAKTVFLSELATAASGGNGSVGRVDTTSAVGGTVTEGVVSTWEATYAGAANLNDVGNSMIVAPDGAPVVAGRSIESGTYPDFLTLKFNAATGTQTWKDTYNPANSYDEASFSALGADGTIYVTGASYGSGTQSDIAVRKLAADGTPAWTYRYDGPVHGADAGKTAIPLADGSVAFCGYSANATASPYNYDIVVGVINANGTQQWAQRWGGAAGGDDQPEPKTFQVDAEGNIYLAGVTTIGGSSTDLVVQKWSSTGTLLWSKTYNGPGNLADYGSAAKLDSQGDYVVGGYSIGAGTGYDYVVLKFDANGNQLWASRYNGPSTGTDKNDQLRDLVLDAAGNIIVCGDSASDAAGNLHDFAIVKFDPDGAQTWAMRYDGTGQATDIARALAVDAAGNTYVCGPSPGAASGNDWVVLKLTAEGQAAWTYRYNGPASGDDTPQAIALGAASEVYVTGYTTSTGSGQDLTVLRLDQTVTYTPPAGFTGRDSFGFVVHAPGGVTYAQAEINVTEPFVPDTPFVGQVNGSYGDPEFSVSASQVVFQDNQNNLWIGDLDPETGSFKTPTGRDYLMDTNISQIMNDGVNKFSSNGPEWSKDGTGHFVVYTKADQAGIQQQWIARLVNGQSVVTQLTTDAKDCYGNMPSRYDDGLEPRVAFNYDWPITEAKLGWVFVDDPQNIHVIDAFDPNQMSMWSAVSSDFLYVHRPAGAPIGQIARLNVDSGAVTVLTNDAGDKNDPGFFRAPEFGGEICLVARVDNQSLAIYRDLGSPDGFWTRVATLTLPAGTPHKYIFSAEPIAPATGVGGMSYFTFNASATNDWGGTSERSIWVLGLGTEPTNRFVRRIDDGAISGASAVRMEPEPFVTEDEVFVYYNFYNPGTGEHGLRRASTGIYLQDLSIPHVSELALLAANGEAYSLQLSASRGTAPYSWTLASGSLPPGLSLSADGAVSGIPAATGVFEFTVQASDAQGATATKTFAITVIAPFTPDDVQVGAPGVNYSDPEFLSSANRMVFQTTSDGVQQVWISELNPTSGLLASPDGRDLLVDTNVATLGPTKQTNNGPEWGVDSAGAALFYSKPDGGGIPQVFRASNLTSGAVTVTQMTNVTGPSWATNATVRQDASLPTTKFFYRYAAGPELTGPARWADETNPTAVNNITAFNTAGFAPSWIQGTEDFAYCVFTSQTTTEIGCYSTATRTVAAITSEPTVAKQNIIAFYAPEFDNELCYACVVDVSALAIYRNLGSGYTRVATLTPNVPGLPYMYSPEMFQLDGVTYFAVVMQDNQDYHLATEGAIYVLGLGSDAANRLVRRVDNGTAANRFEPEVMVGTEEVFVFFNDGGSLRRARTGVFVEPPEPPTDLNLASNSVGENSANGTVVGALQTTDPQLGDMFNYTLLNDAGGRFALSGTQIVVANGSLLDRETATTHTIRVRTTDHTGLSLEKDLLITVTDVNESPTNISLSPSSIAENSANGTMVGNFSTSDPDAGDTFAYTLVDSAGGRFAISGSQVVVANGVLLDYETATSHTIRVRTTDRGGTGLSFEKDLQITVTNVNESPTNLSLASSSISENSVNGTVVGNLSTSDPDAGDTFAYTLVDSAGGRFAVSGSEVLVANGSLLDYETATSHTIRVRTMDQGGSGLSFEKDLLITVTDLNDTQSLDADDNGTADALSDGILILRYLFDPAGQWNYSDALGSEATRTTRAAIKGFLDGGRTTVLDVDGNGSADALTDGILILRYLFDPTGAWNYSDALGAGATRTTREQIKAYLDEYNPALASPPGGASAGSFASSSASELVSPDHSTGVLTETTVQGFGLNATTESAAAEDLTLVLGSVVFSNSGRVESLRSVIGPPGDWEENAPRRNAEEAVVCAVLESKQAESPRSANVQALDTVFEEWNTIHDDGAFEEESSGAEGWEAIPGGLAMCLLPPGLE
jgi:catechol 2,3-dioxygenase-like lactoylglutathione lyase family enzyme